ncbi:putative RNA 2'-phosphotransferase [Paenibacillus sp. UNC496MF]|uniref:RNA 2'-phosphotransferase n=1 Tax=Paenibacillus sp. UNC496MF TaxID=1502753 RepID=UPI0008E242E7|nr:RNA 2'-phosphotransferase [Paenibacillus sp. UNC496MF]SFJ21675.1 putative RNA 2'-phosphotransferase [Paenibacillus sp. UNC496MF]
MTQRDRDAALGRFLSLVLRHDPSAAGIRLDANGWADVRELLAGCARAGKAIDFEALARIVRENDKQRYGFNEDRTKIRANQGHSVGVDVELPEAVPPDKLYHGTATRFLDGIRAQGIRPGARRHVHLSADRAAAVEVGRRHGRPLALHVDAAAMRLDGRRFYLSANGVWLCDEVPWRYVTVPEGE